MKKFLFACCLLTATLIAQQPQQQWTDPPPDAQTKVTVGWTLSPSTNISSQFICWGLYSRSYAWTRELPPDTTRFQITDLQPGTTYYIALMCRQAIGTTGTNLIKSDYGNEIVWTTIPTARPEPPKDAAVVSAP